MKRIVFYVSVLCLFGGVFFFYSSGRQEVKERSSQTGRTSIKENYSEKKKSLFELERKVEKLERENALLQGRVAVLKGKATQRKEGPWTARFNQFIQNQMSNEKLSVHNQNILEKLDHILDLNNKQKDLLEQKLLEKQQVEGEIMPLTLAEERDEEALQTLKEQLAEIEQVITDIFEETQREKYLEFREQEKERKANHMASIRLEILNDMFYLTPEQQEAAQQYFFEEAYARQGRQTAFSSSEQSIIQKRESEALQKILSPEQFERYQTQRLGRRSGLGGGGRRVYMLHQ